MKKNKVVFFGTPWIASECLKTLYSLPDCEIVAIVCQPDRELDRKKSIIISETKKFALEHNIECFQPEKIIEIYQDLLALEPDIFITCAYGQFIPDKILTIPKFKCVNVHASLLPQLRGGAPIHWAIINQLPKTGISLMYSIKQMDAGNIIYQEAIKIDDQETYSSLLIKLALLAQEMLRKYFSSLCQENVNSTPQDETKVSFAYNIKKTDELLDFNLTANKVDAKVRGLYNKPIAKISYQNQLYKVHHGFISNEKCDHFQPGQIVKINKQGIWIACSDFFYVIDVIQIPNKKPLPISELINGNLEFKINTSIDVLY